MRILINLAMTVMWASFSGLQVFQVVDTGCHELIVEHENQD